MKINGTHQLLVYGDKAEEYVLCRKTETLVVARKEIGLELNADKAKHIIMSQDQNAGRKHSI
jgi:hypothetical protein